MIPRTVYYAQCGTGLVCGYYKGCRIANTLTEDPLLNTRFLNIAQQLIYKRSILWNVYTVLYKTWSIRILTKCTIVCQLSYHRQIFYPNSRVQYTRLMTGLLMCHVNYISLILRSSVIRITCRSYHYNWCKILSLDRAIQGAFNDIADL